MNKFLYVGFFCALFSVFGCKTVTGDPLLVRAEQVREGAYQTFKTYAKFEKENREALWKVSHGFKQAADDIRQHGPNALEALTKAIDAYKVFKDQKGREELFAQIQLVNALVSQAADAYANGKAVK